MTELNYNRRTIQQAFEHTLEAGGGTFNTLMLGDYAGARNVWAVGGLEFTRIIDVDTLSFDRALLIFSDAYLRLLDLDVRYIGTWLDEGVVYIEGVSLIGNTDEAIDLGYERGQKAIYNLSSKRTLELS